MDSEQVENRVGREVWDQVCGLIRRRAERQVENRVGRGVWDQVWIRVESRVKSRVSDQAEEEHDG